MQRRRWTHTTATGAAAFVATMAACGQGQRDALKASDRHVDVADEAGAAVISGGPNDDRLCPNAPTTIAGIVKDPRGMTPLYNVLVYVPTEAVEPMPPPGPSCLQCGTPVSGKPAVKALTNTAGEFRLINAPAGKDIPLVIQVGKWRRQTVVKNVKPCQENFVGDFEETRLPKKQSEGDMPQIALSTGGFDPLECLLRKIGIDDSEFTSNLGNGRVHVFQGAFGSQAKDAAPDARSLWSHEPTLAKYDMVMLGCEGDVPYADSGDGAGAPSAKLLYNYANAGGRIFATHYHYYWFEFGPTGPLGSFRDVATWTPSTATTGVGGIYNVDMSFPKGKAFAEWLKGVGASPIAGVIGLQDVREDIGAVNAAQGTQRWIYQGNSTKYLSFNTPIDKPADEQCGRAVLSDVHVSSGDETGTTFPNGCKSTVLSAQEQALEFLLFDLSACVQDDKKPPEVPR
ncbi:MAG: carboxypeptidase regulatory-like domain-containing protein [Myxococcales bacterium]|nr:carboxypeptidase regulatory-like domain-containing protein [Myxococcales bacterium]